MTVTLTNDHGYLNDCDTTTGFTKTDDGNTSTFTVDNSEYFKLAVTVSGGNEETKVVNNVNIGASTTLFPLILWRYKCSNSNIKAKIIAEFDDASEQLILADSNSIIFTVGSATLSSPTSNLLDHIHLYADHAVGTVYYDFILVCHSQFPLPNVAGGMNIDFPPRTVLLAPFGRDTSITQHGGTENAVVTLGCDLDQGDWKRAGDNIDGEVFLHVLHNQSAEPWQWLETGSHRFKVTVHPRFRWVNDGDGSTSRLLDLTLTEYSLGSKSGESHEERWGLKI